MKPNDDSFGSSPAQNGYRREYASVEPYAASVMKVITLRRRGSTPLGFSIRGGWEHGTGIFVSEMVHGSIAQRQGLRVGDQIVRINGFSIHRAIHMEVLNLLKTCPGIVLKVKRVGILPVKERDKDPVTWKVVDPNSPLICSDQVMHSRVNGSTLENCIIVKIEINVPGSSSLGCSIAKGPAEMPGIFMCTVKEGGMADQAGLEVGDQILDMNGSSFRDVKLNEAVALMKSSKHIRLSVKKGAGICLFLENSAANRLTNGNNKNGDSFSSSRSLSDGPSTPVKDHDFTGSCSSKSEESSFQSSDSEKDFSISEESAYGGGDPLKDNSTCSSWVLEQDKGIVEEEKRSQPSSLEEGARESFLEELQKVAARMNTKEGKGEMRNGSTIGKLQKDKEDGFKGKKGKDDTIKRMQHEMLMEEFREAHRKMFGQQPVVITNGKENENQCSGVDTLKSTSAPKGKGKPPPPPPPQKEYQKITVNGQIPTLQSQTLPRPEKMTTHQVRTSMDDMDRSTNVPPTFRISVTENPGPKSRPLGALVEVTPWTTRL